MAAEKRVLVVDDDDAIREVATLALELVGGLRVSTASSGDAAWQSALRDRPDAVLLDVMMPGLDGPSTLAKLRRDPRTRDIPVIFLTAKTQAGRPPWRDLDIAGVIAKPFDPMTLAAEVGGLLRWQR